MTNQPPEDPMNAGQGASGAGPNYGSPNYGAPSYGTPGGSEQAAASPYGGGHPTGGPATPPERPGSLALAVKLMYVGAALSLLGMLTTFLMMDSMRDSIEQALRDSGETVTEDLVNASVAVGVGVAVFIGLIGTGLWILMAVMNSKGKQWARITATVFGVLGILFQLIGFAGAAGGGSTGLSMALGVVNLLLAIAILVLLWRKENNPYYEAMTAPKFAS